LVDDIVDDDTVVRSMWLEEDVVTREELFCFMPSDTLMYESVINYMSVKKVTALCTLSY